MLKEVLSVGLPTELQSQMEQSLADVTVIIPIGGNATRAQKVTGDLIPKHLIKLGNGQPIVDNVCRNLQQVGFRQFVFCVGHHKDQIKDHISSGSWIAAKGVSYEFSQEETPLGPDGAVLQAIGLLGLKGQGLVVPGDMMLPWLGIADMTKRQPKDGTDVTVGVTSHVTDRTTDLGRLIVEDKSNRLLWCYGRSEEPGESRPGSRGLTSAAAMAISINRYKELCETYIKSSSSQVREPLSLRDQVLPWAVRANCFQILAYDLGGEALDLGSPSNIHYGQQNWEQYV